MSKIIKRGNLKKLAFYYLVIKLVISGLDYVLGSNYFSIPSLEYKTGSDFSLNDLHYKLDSSTRDVKRFENLILVNSGSLNQATFRLELAQLVDSIKQADAKVIALDIDFSNDTTKPGTCELLNQLNNTSSIVLAERFRNDSGKLRAKKAVYGGVMFPEEQFTIRRYGAGDTTFAYKIAKAYGADVTNFDKLSKNFVLNYTAHDYFQLDLKSANPIADYTFSQHPDNTIPMIDGAALLSNDSLEISNVKQILKGKIVLIGHLGNSCLDDLKNDLEDKHPAPCDHMLINRQKSMPGVLIHANAVENMINPKSQFTVVSDNIFFIVFEELLLILYLCFLLFVKAGKVINIMLMLALSLPALYVVLLLMNYNIYIEMGTTLLQLLVFEELAELIEPLYAKFERFKFRFTKLKFIRK
jgi:CHASE2 domain-containing sensor protein